MNVIKIWFSSLDFVDVIPKDPLTGDDGHLDGINAYLDDDYIFNTWTTFKISSLEAMTVAAPWIKDPAQYLPYVFESSNNMTEFLLIECCHVYYTKSRPYLNRKVVII